MSPANDGRSEEQAKGAEVKEVKSTSRIGAVAAHGVSAGRRIGGIIGLSLLFSSLLVACKSQGSPETTVLTETFLSSAVADESVAAWQDNMVRYGVKVGESLDPQGDNKGYGETYYDAAWVFYQIADYTGQKEPWEKYAAWAVETYLDYLEPSYEKPGYWLFSHGLRENLERGGIVNVGNLIKLRDLPAFSNPGWDWNKDGYDDGKYESVSREIAYNLQTHINAEKAGLPRDGAGEDKPRPQYYVEYMEAHLNEWRNQSYRDPQGGRFAPFMFGLTAHALIEFYEWEQANGRDPNAYWPAEVWPTIVDALADLAYWAFNDAKVAGGPHAGKRMWVENVDGHGNGAFRYEDIKEAIPAPDLNLLIAPTYAWLYRQTGDAAFRNMGDVIFSGGVEGAFLDGGKQFNQNYRLSFFYIKWRDEGDARHR